MLETGAVSIHLLEIRDTHLTVHNMQSDTPNMDAQQVVKLQEQMTSLETQASTILIRVPERS
jgi:hypothetical protein